LPASGAISELEVEFQPKCRNIFQFWNQWLQKRAEEAADLFTEIYRYIQKVLV
jgi:hypothetical protein